jgi:divalent metal cation (Fe/Co/Zn/Cd) transporter
MPSGSVFSTITGAAALSAAKFAAAALGGSASMLAEGVHSAVNAGNGADVAGPDACEAAAGPAAPVRVRHGAVLIGLLMACVALGLAYQCKQLLLGESATKEMKEAV